MRASSSIRNLPTSPACSEVPQASRWIRSIAAASAALKAKSSKPTLSSSKSTRPAKVSWIACGWSWISLSMKCLKPPFSAWIGSQLRRIGGRSMAAPSAVDSSTPPLLSRARSPFSRKTTSRVKLSSAAGSEARNCSPSPSPSTSGGPWRATTISGSGDSTETAAKANIPSSSASDCRTAERRSPPSRCELIRLATTSVSVSEANSQPSAASRCLSGRKFSMMPLWISATRPRASSIGWALRSDGGPWVAQRVWPSPQLPSSR